MLSKDGGVDQWSALLLPRPDHAELLHEAMEK
jgi:hypothetical protein